jgi:2-keto-4-pentenoate hydratase/2-oxohepta-3-ene-1,7-dioic acid hydratase in catechol pathway
MKLMMFKRGWDSRLGLVEGDTVFDVAAADPTLPADLLGFIRAGDWALDKLRAVPAKAPTSARASLSRLEPALPIADPPKFLCVGLNYLEHAKEGGHAPPTYPSLFPRWSNSLIPARAPVVRPKSSIQLDYECELTIVIGKGGRHIAEASALDHVFGYTIFNDVSVRDFQRKTSQWLPGKNFDSTGPLGPYVVTADALPPGASGLDIMTRVNGQTMQSSNTSDMIFPVAKIIETVSAFMTLEPGDLIATGTPSGVAHARKPPAWMKAGDTVEIEIEKIGILKNTIVDEA